MREHGKDSETLNVIYVVDDRGVLIDDIRMREFLVRPLDDHVSRPDGPALRHAQGDRPRKGRGRGVPSRGPHGAPGHGHVGRPHRRRHDRRRAGRGGRGGHERHPEDRRQRGPRRTLHGRSASRRWSSKRAGWLVVLFLGEMLTATAMGFFEKEIERAVVLALFVPLIISSGGNSGSQASTLVIRALALGEVRLADWWRVDPARSAHRARARRHSRDRSASCASRSGRRSSRLYGAHWLLVATTVGGRARRHRALGHAHRVDPAVHPAPARLRPGDILGAVCRHARGRHRPRDLFQRRDGDPAGHTALAANSAHSSRLPGRSAESAIRAP